MAWLVAFPIIIRQVWCGSCWAGERTHPPLPATGGPLCSRRRWGGTPRSSDASSVPGPAIRTPPVKDGTPCTWLHSPDTQARKAMRAFILFMIPAVKGDARVRKFNRCFCTSIIMHTLLILACMVVTGKALTRAHHHCCTVSRGGEPRDGKPKFRKLATRCARRCLRSSIPFKRPSTLSTNVGNRINRRR